jgi:hypothetical protein
MLMPNANAVVNVRILSAVSVIPNKQINTQNTFSSLLRVYMWYTNVTSNIQSVLRMTQFGGMSDGCVLATDNALSATPNERLLTI